MGWRITRESRSPVQARTRDLDNLRLASTVRPGSTPANLVPRSSGRNSLSSRVRTALSLLGRNTRANRRTPAARSKDRLGHHLRVKRRRGRRTKVHSLRDRSTRVVPALAGRSTWVGLRHVSLVVPV